MVKAVGRFVGEGDPDDLRLLTGLAADVEEALAAAVQRLRRQGFTDGDIGTALGVSRVTVIRRWPATWQRKQGAAAWRR
jgi:response regulator of citrate/malate metabolism